MTARSRAFCSWSGGKDAALAMHEARLHGLETELLITMMTERGTRSRSHGLSREVLDAQARATGIRIHYASTSWDAYERTFGEQASSARSAGLRDGIFGDIDGERSRQWVVNACSASGVTAHLPLWGRPRKELLQLLLARRFHAVVIAVRVGVVSESMLGCPLDAGLLRRLERSGVDASGEGGEYHTLVLDGPIFVRPLDVTFGGKILRDGVWFLDCAPSVANE